MQTTTSAFGGLIFDAPTERKTHIVVRPDAMAILSSSAGRKSHRRAPAAARFIVGLVLTLLSFLIPFGAAQAADLVLVRTLSVAASPTRGLFSYSLIYKNGGPDTVNGAVITETLPAGFQITNIACVAAFGGVCPTFTINNAAGAIATATLPSFPAFAQLKLTVSAAAASEPGSYQFSGSIANPGDTLQTTNEVISNFYVRPRSVDMRVTHSDVWTGGANGLGGLATATINGDTGQTFPAEQTFRLENLGPEPIVGTDFNFFMATLGGPLALRALSEYMSDVPGAAPPGGFAVVQQGGWALPFDCTAIGTVQCPPGGKVYAIANRFAAFGSGIGRVGWLDHAPTWELTTANNLGRLAAALIPADTAFAQANPSPAFSQIMQPGDALVLKISLPTAVPRISGTPAENLRVLDDWELTKTSDLSSSCTSSQAVGSTTFNITYRALSIADPNFGNNFDASTVTANRTCPVTDLQVTVAATTSVGSDAIIANTGENYAVTYTFTNNGPNASQKTRLQLQGSGPSNGGPPNLNWLGFTRTIACVSSDPINSPCPLQPVLDALLTGVSQDWVGNFGNAASWTITVGGYSGTTTVCGVAYVAGILRPSAQVLAMGMADPVAANNSNVTNLTANAPFCPAPANYDLATVKQGPFDINGTPLASLSQGGRAYFRVTYANVSTNGVSAQNVSISDTIGGSYSVLASPVGSQVGVSGLGPFARDPLQPAGLPLRDSLGVFLADSGIVCTAFAGAACPLFLTASSVTTDPVTGLRQYSGFSGVAPLLPPSACPPGPGLCTTNPNPAARIELVVPYVDQSLVNAACTTNPALVIYRTNTSSIGAITGTSAFTLPDGTPLPTDQWGEATSSNNGSSATVNTGYPACVVGANLSIDKTVITTTLTSGGSAGNRNYTGVLQQPGNQVAFNVLVTNTNAVQGIDRLRLRDVLPVVRCRNNQPSTALNPCGQIQLQTLTCSATGSAICPSGPIVLDASGDVRWGTAGNYATFPAGATYNFQLTYTVVGAGPFLLSVQNFAEIQAVGFAPVATQSALATLTLPQLPGIALVKSVDRPLAPAGATVTYTIDVVNGGLVDQPAGVVFTDPVPPGLTSFTSVSCQGLQGPSALPANVATCPGVITNNASGITATLPLIPANSIIRFTVTAVALGTVTSVNNAASIAIPANGAIVASAQLATSNFAVPAANEPSPLAGYKSIVNITRPGAQNFLPGERLDYVISYANLGVFDINSVQISEVLPAQVTYAGGATITTVPGLPTTAALLGTYNGAGQPLLLQAGATLGAAGVITVRIPVTVVAGTTATPIFNQASATTQDTLVPVLTDNVDRTNPACPSVSAITPCLPGGVLVPPGSVAQPQLANTLSPNQIPLAVLLSGNVFDDINGSQIKDNGETSTTIPTGLNAVITDSNGMVVAVVVIDANGNYSAPVSPNASYTVTLTTASPALFSTPVGGVPVTLPTGWVTTGENLAGTVDGSPNSSQTVSVAAVDRPNVNFGLEQPPVAGNALYPAQINPMGTVSVPVGAGAFIGPLLPAGVTGSNATDPAPGAVTGIRITAFPVNATSITLNGTTYTAASFPPLGVALTPAQLAGMSVDPIDGAVSVVISYTALDAAGRVSGVAGSVTLPFFMGPDVSTVTTAVNNGNGTATFTVVTSNAPTAAVASNTVTTLTMPTGLVGVVVSNGGIYNPVTGVVTWPPIVLNAGTSNPTPQTVTIPYVNGTTVIGPATVTTNGEAPTVLANNPSVAQLTTTLPVPTLQGGLLVLLVGLLLAGMVGLRKRV